ncbi:MAG: hypothetical protein IPL52_14900 [Flavobacteriales bacterium]|nr:hypothetical protein [Flavobacteriales bacterium]
MAALFWIHAPPRRALDYAVPHAIGLILGVLAFVAAMLLAKPAFAQRHLKVRTLLVALVVGATGGFAYWRAPGTQERIAWNRAVSEDNEPIYISYLNTWYAKPQAAEAFRRANDLAFARFDAGNDAEGALGFLEWRMAFWKDHESVFLWNPDTAGFRQQDSIARSVARRGAIPILDLLRSGELSIDVEVGSIERGTVVVRSRTRVPLAIEVSAGLVLEPKDPTTQRMLSIRAGTIFLLDTTPASIGIHVACMELYKDAPFSFDEFMLRSSVNDPILVSLVSGLESSGASSEVAQAAVWIWTDDASYDDMRRFRMRYTFNSPDRPVNELELDAISQAEAIQAMVLCERIGMDIHNRRIWRKRNELTAYGAVDIVQIMDSLKFSTSDGLGR